MELYGTVCKESRRSSKPTKADIRQVRDLLADFCIYDDVPDFDNVKQLDSWKRKLISDKLKEGSHV